LAVLELGLDRCHRAGDPEAAGYLAASRPGEQRQRRLQHPAGLRIIVSDGIDKCALAVRLEPRDEQVEVGRPLLSPTAHRLLQPHVHRGLMRDYEHVDGL
jgi:hypothetical protein